MHATKIGENKVSSVNVKNKKDRKAARSIINKILKECPDRISRELPCGRAMGSEGHDKSEKICEYGERKLKKVLKKNIHRRTQWRFLTVKDYFASRVQ